MKKILMVALVVMSIMGGCGWEEGGTKIPDPYGTDSYKGSDGKPVIQFWSDAKIRGKNVFVGQPSSDFLRVCGKPDGALRKGVGVYSFFYDKWAIIVEYETVAVITSEINSHPNLDSRFSMFNMMSRIKE